MGRLIDRPASTSASWRFIAKYEYGAHCSAAMGLVNLS
jgi:hypothetical protein